MSSYVLTFEDTGTIKEGRDRSTLFVNDEDARYFGVQMGPPGSSVRLASGMPNAFSHLVDGDVRVDDRVYPEGRRLDGTLAVFARVRVRFEGLEDEAAARRVGIDDELLNRMAALIGPDIDLHGEWVVSDVEVEPSAPRP